MTLDLARLYERYAEDYQPRCSGCGQRMECVAFYLFRCSGRFKVGRRWERCPAPEQWQVPTPQSRQDVRALLAALRRTTKRPRRRITDDAPLFAALSNEEEG